MLDILDNFPNLQVVDFPLNGIAVDDSQKTYSPSLETKGHDIAILSEDEELYNPTIEEQQNEFGELSDNSNSLNISDIPTLDDSLEEGNCEK